MSLSIAKSDELPPALPEHIRRVLEGDIIHGRLVAGARITEEELAARFRVSRTPVREAVRQLESQGLIVRRRGCAAHVAARSSAADARVVYELRMVLEGHLTELAAGRLAPETMRRIDELQDRFKATLAAEHEKGDHSTLLTLDAEFHYTIYKAAESDLLSILDGYWRRVYREFAHHVYESVSPTFFSHQHDDIVRALREGDAASAGETMRRHIADSSKALLASYGDGETV